MTPFLQFRIWWRRASVSQRLSSVAAGALVLALVVWTAVPSSNPRPASFAIGQARAGSAAAASGAGNAGTASPGGNAPAGSATSAATSVGPLALGGSSGAGLPAGGSEPAGTLPGTVGLPGSPGCSQKGTLKIGVVVPTAAGGTINGVIGSPPTAQEEADYAAVFDSVNKAGGVDCYNLVGDYATADLTNPGSARSGCLQFMQDKVFAVLGGFEPLFSDDCLLQAHIPTFDQLPIPAGVAKRYYPYYFSAYPTYEVLYRNFVDAVNQMGYFGPSKHFAKLGIFYEDCTPEINQALLSDLAAVGVSGSKVVTFDLGCSGAFSSPSAEEQAVLKFKSAGVTTATFDNDIADAQNITNIAASQGFKPAWILPDYGDVAVTGSANEHPNASEFDGALAITSGQYGAIDSHLPETPGTQACDKVMTSHGLPTVFQSGDQFAGSTCSQVWLLVAALQHAGVSQTALPAGLQAAKTIEVSFPNGPNDFSVAGTTTGGEFWRPDTYHASCQCWMVDNPVWSPSFS
jgi:hypothetical protein